MTESSDQLVFSARNPGRLPVPGVLGCVMVVAFSLPAVMLVATTWKELPNYPWLAAAWVGSLFPLAVLYVIRRLMTRYNLRLYADGLVEIVFPFKTVRIARGELASVTAQGVYVAAIRARRTWLVFASRDGKVLASLSPSAFEAGVVERFLGALREVNPQVAISV